MKVSARSNSPAASLEDVKSVYQMVASVNQWPEDVWWKAKLPNWLTVGFESDASKLWRDEALWDFGSWIDATKDRGWEWWSSCVGEKQIRIWLTATVHPYSIEPLVYVMTARGCTKVEVEEVASN